MWLVVQLNLTFYVSLFQEMMTRSFIVTENIKCFPFNTFQLFIFSYQFLSLFSQDTLIDMTGDAGNSRKTDYSTPEPTSSPRYVAVRTRVVHSQKNFSVPNVFMARELNCSVSDGNTIIEWIIYAFIKPSSLLSQLNSTRLCCAVLFIIYTEHFTKCIELFILFIFIILI